MNRWMPRGRFWIAAYPKSGSNWMRMLITNLMQGGEAPADINASQSFAGDAANLSMFEQCTLLDPSLLTPSEIEVLRPGIPVFQPEGTLLSCFFITYEAWRLSQSGEPIPGAGDMAGVIYLVRDPRDVAVSVAHHFDVSVEDAIAGINSARTRIEAQRGFAPRHLPFPLLDWSGHVRGWLEQTYLPVHVVRYEDMLTAPVDTFTAAMAFVGITASAQAFEEAVRRSDFSELRRQEQTCGFTLRTSRNNAFFRQGTAGEWRSALTPEQSVQIVSHHASVMSALGYGEGRVGLACPHQPR